MHKLKTTIVILVMMSMVLPYFLNPATAQAQQVGPTASGDLGSILIGGFSCTAANKISQWLVEKISTVLTDWLQNLPASIAGFLGIGFDNIFDFFPDAVPTKDDYLKTEIATKEKLLDVVARCFAREVLNDMTARMIGAARTSGRDTRQGQGTPSFVRDWRKFLSNAQYRGENVFRSILSSTTLCPHFSNSLKTAFRATNQPDIRDKVNIRVGNLDPFTLRARCTLPQGWSLNSYNADFAGNGGYSALIRLAEPQNNAFGALLLSLGELAAQRALEERGDSAEAGANAGFTSRRGPPGDTCLVPSINGQCVIYKEILTPGSILQQTVSATIQEELRWIGSVDEWNELITWMMRTTMSRILNLAKPSDYNQEAFPAEQYPGPIDDPRGIDGGTFPPGTIPPGPIPPAPPGTGNVSGFVYIDTNQNGVRDSGEAGFPGSPIQAVSSAGTILDSTTTNSSGQYFVNVSLSETNFNISHVPRPAGYSPTAPQGDNLVVVSLPTTISYDFGIIPDGSVTTFQVLLCPDGDIGGAVDPFCVGFNLSDPDLSDNSNSIDNNASFFVAQSFVNGGKTLAELFAEGFAVELCDGYNYNSPCLNITSSMLSTVATPYGVNEFMFLDTQGFNNITSSIKITNSTGTTLPPPPGPPPPPPSGGESDHISSGSNITAGQQISSPNGRFSLALQGDGNLVLYDGGSAIWSSGTSGNSVQSLEMQGDGNLVIYNSSGSAIWSTGTFSSGSSLWLQNDGNLVIYDAGNSAVWSTGTAR